MTEARHRGPPERPRVAEWVWLTAGSVAITVGTIAVVSWLGPSPEVPDAVEPPPQARSVWTPRDLPSLNVPTPTPAVSETGPRTALSASVSVERPRRVPAYPTRAAQEFQGAQGQVTEAPLAHSDTAAPPADRTPTAPTREPAPIEETQVVEVEQPEATAEPTPTDAEPVPTDIPDLIEEIVETEVVEP